MSPLFPRSRFPRLPAARARFLAERLAAATRRQPRLKELAAHLRALGGRALVPPPAREPHLRLLLGRGKVFDGASAKARRGRASDCHGNVARLWLRRLADFTVGVGYALSDDGLWRQHSWLLDGARVLETTEPRVLYFGCELGLERSLAFAAGQLGPEVVVAALAKVS
ncbi:MAG: hypothetical protein IT373_11675 [Polyangiaceae bacterium]|nr:hypothetical protein [Polyangiaceae bacterium]